MTHVQECSENTILQYTSINLRLNNTSFEKIGFACVLFYVQKVKKFKRSIHVLWRAYKEESDGEIYFDEIKTNAYKRIKHVLLYASTLKELVLPVSLAISL